MMKTALYVFPLLCCSMSADVFAQKEKLAEIAENKATQQGLKDFTGIFRVTTGFSSSVSLKTTGTKRLFRLEGGRCYLEATFTTQDTFGANEKSWVLPAKSFSRTLADESFCGQGRTTTIFIRKAINLGFDSQSYRQGEFNWGGLEGTFEVR